MARWALAAAALVIILAFVFHGSILWTVMPHFPPAGDPAVIRDLKAAGYDVKECPSLMEAARWRASVLGAIYAKFGVDTAHEGTVYVTRWLQQENRNRNGVDSDSFLMSEVIIAAGDTLDSLKRYAPVHYQVVVSAGEKGAYYGYAYVLQPKIRCVPPACESFFRADCGELDFNTPVWYVVIVFARECPAEHFPYKPVNYTLPGIDIMGIRIVDPLYPLNALMTCQKNREKSFEELLALLEK